MSADWKQKTSHYFYYCVIKTWISSSSRWRCSSWMCLDCFDVIFSRKVKKNNLIRRKKHVHSKKAERDVTRVASTGCRKYDHRILIKLLMWFKANLSGLQSRTSTLHPIISSKCDQKQWNVKKQRKIVKRHAMHWRDTLLSFCVFHAGMLVVMFQHELINYLIIIIGSKCDETIQK